MRPVHLTVLAIAIVSLSGCLRMQHQTLPPLRTVPAVDLKRYAGTWHEIARYPHRFQEGCRASRAIYALRDDGNLSVVNECDQESSPDEPRSVTGRAWVVDQETNARLKVSFFWPFAGDYWIIDLSDDYSYAVVGHPSRRYLWILSRSREMPPEVYEAILARLAAQHYDTQPLIRASSPSSRKQR